MKRKSLKCVIGTIAAMVLLTVVLLDSGFAKQKGEVVFAVAYPIFYQVGGDPATHMAGLPLVAQTVFDSLVWVNERQKFFPALAEKYKIHPKWKYIDWHLRKDIKFHNGMKMTAEDVKYSMEQYLRKDFRYLFKPLWARAIKNIEIKSKYHVRFNMNMPDPGFLGRLWLGVRDLPESLSGKSG